MKPQMSYIVDRINRPARLVYCCQAHNEEEFIGLNLEWHYPMFDKMIVIEGAVESRRSISTEDGHSTDRTLEIIRDFKANRDPDNKMTIISLRRFWRNLEELKQTFIDMTSEGDILVICDADEFYRSEDIRRVRQIFDLEPSAREVIPTFLHFYKDFYHIAVPGPEWNCQHQRILRHPGNGARYNSHPVLTDGQGQCMYFSPHYQPFRFVPKNPVYIYHYGYARQNMDERMQEKREYYSRELSKHNNANRKFDRKVEDWFNSTEPLLYYDGDHPDILKNHPGHKRVVDANYKNWQEDTFYNSREPGNIWLCMRKLAQPFMPYYHNGVEI